jgi:predicted HAD superfamily Cof-like phosphohydrolase
MNNELDVIEKIKLFNKIAGSKNEFDIRKINLYTSLVLEEVFEMIEALTYRDSQLQDLKIVLEKYRKQFKEGTHDVLVADVLTKKEKRIELLDAVCDVIVVSAGLGIALGADIQGALHQVSDNNLQKFPIVDGKYTVLRDEHGKIRKPEGFKSVELNAFVD